MLESENLVTARIYKQRLEDFANLVEPIIRRLNVVEEPNNIQDFRQSEESAGTSHFFQSSLDLRMFKSRNSPPLVVGNTYANRRFEQVRQACIRFQYEQFTKLATTTQLIAKVGGLLYSERRTLEQRTYHLMSDGMLIGILDRKLEKLHVRKDVVNQEFSDLHIIARPSASTRNTPGFSPVSIHDSVWTYATHDPEALLDLSTEVGTHLLSIRRLPKVSPNLLTGSQMQLIRKLLLRPHGFDQLSEGLSLSKACRLTRDLTCMVLTQSISVSLSFAPQRSAQQKPQSGLQSTLDAT